MRGPRDNLDKANVTDRSDKRFKSTFFLLCQVFGVRTDKTCTNYPETHIKVVAISVSVYTC